MRINRRNKDVKNTLGRFQPIAPINVERERPRDRISCRWRWHVEGGGAFLAAYSGHGKGDHDRTFTTSNSFASPRW